VNARLFFCIVSTYNIIRYP